MNNYQIPGFEPIDPDNLNDYYTTEIDFQGRMVPLDINFDEYAIDRQKLEAVEPFVANPGLYHDKAVAAMQQDYLSGTIVKPYLEEHLNLFTHQSSAAEPATITGEGSTKQIAQLYLKRIGFYPENENEFAVFDYTINEEETQYLIVVNFKKDGEIDNLTMES